MNNVFVTKMYLGCKIEENNIVYVWASVNTYLVFISMQIIVRF
jgi:hypothetical protein